MTGAAEGSGGAGSLEARNHLAGGDTYPFLEGGGEMGAFVRAHDWALTPVGRPDHWPQALRTAVRLMLNTGHPMYIFWGPEGTCFYNDAYRRSIGPERHPVSLGQPVRQVWDEIWDIIGPQIEHSELFPSRTNISWWARTGPDSIRARIFERGVGETLSSGTGACGAAIASVIRGGDSPVTVMLDGGELAVDIGEDLHVDLTGWALPIYSGELAPELSEQIVALSR